MDPGNGFEWDFGGLFGDLAEVIAGGFSGIVSFLTDKFGQIHGSLVSLIDYFNPSSDSFILKIAFIPEEGYFENKINELKDKAQDSVGLFSQLEDTFNSVAQAVTDDDHWEGVKVDLSCYGVGNIGEVMVIDPTFINFSSDKIKFWISGLIWFTLLLWLVRRVAGFWGRGE